MSIAKIFLYFKWVGKYLAILLILCVSGCAQTHYLNSDVSLKKLEQNDCAILVMRCMVKCKGLFSNAEIPVKLTLARVDSNYDDPKLRTTYRVEHTPWVLGVTWSKEPDMLMIKPGLYVIEDISWTDGSYNYHSELSGLSLKGKINYGAFRVKPGQVAYLGDVFVSYFKMSDSNGGMNFNVVDMHENAKKALATKYAEANLAERMAKIKLYLSGIITKLDDNTLVVLENTDS